MEDFKKLPKMQTFKIGGFVTKKEFKSFEKKEEPVEEAKDTAQDKAMVKKGVSQHESALHKGEPKTELKLKTGGRAKKKEGTVKKYKTGGEVTNVYEAKKSAGDKDNIKKVKGQEATKLCGGGKAIKKMADGSSTGPLDGLAALAQRAYRRGKRNLLGTDAQNAQAQADINARAAAQAPAPMTTPEPAPTPAMPATPAAPAGVPAQKRGGKVKGKK